MSGVAMPRVVGMALPGTVAVGTCLCGVLATSLATLWLWTAWSPPTTVELRIQADGPSAASRATLAEIALRFATAPDRPVSLQDGGSTLVVSAQDAVAQEAARRVRSIGDAILNTPLPLLARPPAPSADASSEQDALLADRSRLLAAGSQLDAQAASLSSALTALAQNLAAAQREAAARRPDATTADKGAAALADLQIQRFTLLSKYQADYPAVTALDAQIRALKAFLADQARTAEVHAPRQSDPGEAALTTERGRLQDEMGRLEDRRRAISAEVASLDRHLAMPEPLPVPPGAPAVLLLEGATTVEPGVDERAVPVATVLMGGLALSGLALLFGRRRHVAPAPAALAAPPSSLALPMLERRMIGGEQVVLLRMPVEAA